MPLAICAASLATNANAAESATESLHTRIDRVLAASIDHPVAEVATDAEFLRRIWLDLAGMPPSPDDVKAFLADTAPQKRAAAVDRVLESPHFARHLATTLDVMLMERRAAKNVPDADWQAYIFQACRENRPLNELARAILRADSNDTANRPAAKFYLDRGPDPNLITRDVGRVFLGRDMQCAQCHNHPLISDYLQADYHGLLAFFESSSEQKLTEGKTARVAFAEQPGKNVVFDSVFVKNDKHMSGPRVPLESSVNEPIFAAGDEFRVRAAENVVPVLKSSRRALLADSIAGGKNQTFNENLANRLWALMMGRGLVYPVDGHQPDNPPVHPELLKLLGTELAAMKFDTRAFLREIALSKAYSRSVDLPRIDPSRGSEVMLKIAESKKLAESLHAKTTAAKTSFDAAVKAWYDAETTQIAAVAPVDAALAKHAEGAKASDAAVKVLTDTEVQLKARREAAAAVVEASNKAAEVVKRLPAEKELAAAAQKFVDRAKSIAPEVTTLEKTVAEKSTLAKKAADALVPLVKAVDDARIKAAPAREATLQKEQAVLAARRVLNEARVAEEHEKRRLKSLEAEAQFLLAEERIAGVKKTVESKRAELAKLDAEVNAAKQRAAELEKTTATAESTKLAAEKKLSETNAINDAYDKKIASVAKAIESADSARQQLGDDALVNEALAKLKTRADQLKLQSSDPKAKRTAAQADVQRAVDALKMATQTRDVARKVIVDRTAAVKKAQDSIDADDFQLKALAAERGSAVETLTTYWSNDFSIAQLKPLTPEQLGWSIMKASGVYDQYERQEIAALEKAQPLNDQTKRDPAKMKARAVELEQRVFDKLKGVLPTFVATYAAGAGQPQNDFFATVDQALFISNGEMVNNWFAPSGTNVSGRMVAEKDLAKAASDLYLTVLNRPASVEESADVTRVLTEQSANKPAAVQELLWGLLTSAEFRFNH